MAHLQTHALLGMALQQAGGIPALPLAAWTHVPLDDLNWGRLVWYHGIGTGWRRWAGIAGHIVTFSLLSWILWNHPLLLLGAASGCWADFEHPIRWVMRIKKHPIHDNLWPKVLQGQWGLAAWFGVMGAGFLALWRLWK